MALLPIPVDGQLHYFGFRITGFKAPYTGSSAPIDVEGDSEHDLALLDDWKAADEATRDELELQFKLGPVVRPLVQTDAPRSGVCWVLTRDQYEDATNPLSKAQLADELAAARAELEKIKAGKEEVEV